MSAWWFACTSVSERTTPHRETKAGEAECRCSHSNTMEVREASFGTGRQMGEACARAPRWCVAMVKVGEVDADRGDPLAADSLG